jgi:hypothetical protein
VDARAVLEVIAWSRRAIRAARVISMTGQADFSPNVVHLVFIDKSNYLDTPQSNHRNKLTINMRQ